MDKCRNNKKASTQESKEKKIPDKINRNSRRKNYGNSSSSTNFKKLKPPEC